MSERFFWCNKLDYPYLVCSELGNSCIRALLMIAVSLNVGHFKPSKLYMCTQNTTNTMRTDTRRRVYAAMVPYRRATWETSLWELYYNNVRRFLLLSKKKLLVSKMQLWLWNICLSFSKIWADNFFLVCKFYSLKYKIYVHDIWIWEFSHVWNKGETGYSYIISLLKKHSVEFFILHNNIHGNFPLFGRFALKISVFCRFIFAWRFSS